MSETVYGACAKCGQNLVACGCASETGPSAEEQATEAANDVLRMTEAWDGGRPAHPQIVSRLLRFYREAKRSAHLEDARAVCHWCGNGNPARSAPIYTDQPKPVRWFHRFPNQADDQCIAGPVWDALSLPPGGQN